MKRTLILTTPMVKGEDVKFAQRLLKRHGDYDGRDRRRIRHPLRPSELPGPVPARLRQAHQAFGTPLEKLLTGEAKPTAAMKKRSRQEEEGQKKRSGLRLKALAEMKKLIGTTEHPPRSNKTTCGRVYGVQDEWCAMAVTMAYVKAGSTGFARGSRWAFVPFVVQAARAGQYGLTVTTDPKPGDLVCYDLDGTNFAGHKNHIGMFEKATGPNTFQTIEGNINDTLRAHEPQHEFLNKIVFVHASK